MYIREASHKDWNAIWPIFSEVVSTGETYAYPQNISKEEAEKLWLSAPQKTFVIESQQTILGTYYLKPNQAGPGSHVSNCGYMVAPHARGKGIAKKMCLHSQEAALKAGFQAMQFNCVVSNNLAAVHLWHKLGFETVGVLPRAFRHPTEGLVDAYVMYKWLA